MAAYREEKSLALQGSHCANRRSGNPFPSSFTILILEMSWSSKLKKPPKFLTYILDGSDRPAIEGQCGYARSDCHQIQRKFRRDKEIHLNKEGLGKAINLPTTICKEAVI